ncbi:hypothetical protein SAMN05519103_06940 [Rhizobiales bacterium GAS113]|jgi:hypothetical protein|nr:hypothetical protein SAMN05519103_06940 [Rhizobiales bacterium GAS113]SED57363.1 hypothetical protein SAMN05519104_3842 [Rhizobiales bacterium GAS188]
MRTIQISVETFAAIWKAQQPGEASEEAILRRVLNVRAPANAAGQRDIEQIVGFADRRYNVVLPPGFRIFRTYKGTDYSAEAVQGFWVLNTDGKGYATLNELSTAIGASSENAWANWFFLDERGNRLPMSEKRDQAKILRRYRHS